MTFLDNLFEIKTIKKEHIADFAEYVQRLIDEGHQGGLETYARAHYLEKIAAGLKKSSKGKALEEAETYNKSDRTILGTKFTIRSGYALLDYSGDETYNDLAAMAEEISAKLKARQDLLKSAYDAAQKNSTIMDDESGEILTPPKVKGYTANTLAITL